MVTYIMCQPVLSYIKWWPIHVKGSANLYKGIGRAQN